MTTTLGRVANRQIGERTGRAHDQRVTIGRRMRGSGGAGVAAGARAIFDDEILAERCRHPVEQDARDDIAGAAGGERHENLDRPVGIGIRRRHCRHDDGRNSGRAEGQE